MHTLLAVIFEAVDVIQWCFIKYLMLRASCVLNRQRALAAINVDLPKGNHLAIITLSAA
jgi:hypothetical protein